MQNLQTAQDFSNGAFEKCFDKLTEQSIWQTYGEQTLVGAQEIIPFCKQVRAYFDSVETIFTTKNTLVDGNSIAIRGTAQFRRDGKLVSEIDSCDVYEFDEAGNIVRIDSYCIKAHIRN